jgi:hypothetical protein
MSRARKLVTATVLILALASAAAWAAAPKKGAWEATKVELGYDLKFKVAKGKVKNVVGHVLERCDGSSTSTTTTFAPDGSWKVRNGKFSGRKKEQGSGVTVYYTFEGRFTSRTKAKGKLRMESIVAGSVCDTYELDWTAERGG